MQRLTNITISRHCGLPSPCPSKLTVCTGDDGSQSLIVRLFRKRWQSMEYAFGFHCLVLWRHRCKADVSATLIEVVQQMYRICAGHGCVWLPLIHWHLSYLGSALAREGIDMISGCQPSRRGQRITLRSASRLTQQQACLVIF